VGDGGELLRNLNEYYGSSYQTEGKLLLRKGKLFLFTGTPTKLPYDRIGLHIANTDLSLTVEGAQLLGTTSTSNIIEITREQADRFYRGGDIEGYGGEGNVILRTVDSVIGPGLLAGGRIINTLPKSRKTKY
jgi:NOL1/NOP2/fmu family ribosome biogenesis protein